MLAGDAVCWFWCCFMFCVFLLVCLMILPVMCGGVALYLVWLCLLLDFGGIDWWVLC